MMDYCRNAIQVLLYVCSLLSPHRSRLFPYLSISKTCPLRKIRLKSTICRPSFYTFLSHINIMRTVATLLRRYVPRGMSYAFARDMCMIGTPFPAQDVDWL